MKNLIFLSFLFICTNIQFALSQEVLEVEGKIQSDSLVSDSDRVIQADTEGVLKIIPNGEEGDLLTQTVEGVKWEPAPKSNYVEGTGCMNPPCPTAFSSGGNNSTWGACMRACETLNKRVPTLNEAIHATIYTSSNTFSGYIWTRTPQREELSFDTDFRLMMLVFSPNLGEAVLPSYLGGDILIQCGCVD